ncbi:MAG: class I SAM-dependent rRNA methyltransferase [Bacteroidetes bacterium]|nr:class I SAM-dependent rRNA methyltransferase [Bacteroidota bacterium]
MHMASEQIKKIFLKPGKERPVKRFHPWVFSGAIARWDEKPADGELIELYDSKEQFLASGHYQDSSIAIRLISFEAEAIDPDFWFRKIEAAWSYRKRAGYLSNSSTNCYRLIHAEGDGLPGLIIDIYGSTAVVQCHSIGMFRDRKDIAAALRRIYGESLKTIFDKSSETLPSNFGRGVQNGFLHGSESTAVVKEHGHHFLVDWVAGQKTGFFLDQRDNRHMLSQYVKDKKVLNAFCYSGGFSVYALAAGAAMVHSVDISEKAIAWTDRNVNINELPAGRHRSMVLDVMEFMRDTEEEYEVMVVDPPAFAKSLKKRHNAVQAYKRLNALALKKIAPGGILFTFSCSQVVDRKLFYDTIVAAAIEAGRSVRVMRSLSQPSDHPVQLFHPESRYLKGLVLYVS